MSWSFLQDSFHTTLSLQFRPSLIAVAMIYFSVKCLGIIVPSQGAQNTWWKVSMVVQFTENTPVFHDCRQNKLQLCTGDHLLLGMTGHLSFVSTCSWYQICINITTRPNAYSYSPSERYTQSLRTTHIQNHKALEQQDCRNREL